MSDKPPGAAYEEAWAEVNGVVWKFYVEQDTIHKFMWRGYGVEQPKPLSAPWYFSKLYKGKKEAWERIVQDTQTSMKLNHV